MKVITDEDNINRVEIRKKKKLEFGDKEETKKDEKEEIPREMIRTDDDLLIENFDVDYEEEDPDVRMLGGIRGIRALRVQRDYLKDVDTNKIDESSKGNMFAKYEELKQ